MARCRRWCTVLAAVVAAIAVLVGRQPEALLRVPTFGFVLYGLATGRIPPNFDHSCWSADVVHTWTRPGDVVATVGAKMGTTWMLNTLHQIRTAGTDTDFAELMEMTPWPEFLMYPGQPAAELVQYCSRLADEAGTRGSEQAQPSFRTFKSHYAPPKLPYYPHLKYVVGMRNPLDTAVSMSKMIDEITEQWRRLWGGFPPRSADGITDEEFADMLLVRVGPGKAMWDSFMAPYYKSWWSLRNKSNVHIVHYSDRKRDPAGDLDRLLEFLEVDLSPAAKARVLEHISFSWMKEHQDQFSTDRLPRTWIEQGKLDPAADKIMRPGTLMRRGVDGDGKRMLSPEVQRRLHELIDRDLRYGPGGSEELYQFVMHGSRPGAANDVE